MNKVQRPWSFPFFFFKFLSGYVSTNITANSMLYITFYLAVAAKLGVLGILSPALKCMLRNGKSWKTEHTHAKISTSYQVVKCLKNESLKSSTSKTYLLQLFYTFVHKTWDFSCSEVSFSFFPASQHPEGGSVFARTVIVTPLLHN